jgi:hypothetical protein
MTTEPEEPVPDLLGHECEVVAFVRDYLILYFGPAGGGLQCIGTTTIERNTERWTFPEPGSRDGLCSLLGGRVESAEARGDKWLRIRFADGAVLTVEPWKERPGWEAWYLARKLR